MKNINKKSLSVILANAGIQFQTTICIPTFARMTTVLIIISLMIPSHSFAEQGHDEHGEEQGITLTKEQQELVNLKVEALVASKIDYQLYAPGDIQSNGYTSYLVSPRVDSVVLQRHKALGDHVQKGEELVTLFSENVAQAQSEYRVNSAEWRRVKQLGKKAIGAKRYIQAQNDFNLSKARLTSYGLSDKAITSNKTPLGQYTLIANTQGAIISDDFQQGQRVEAGHSLMLLSDEQQLWVESHLQPNLKLELPVGTKAQVKVGDEVYAAEVSQAAHTIDATTRTRIIRLIINNDKHKLHPGLFADVYFTFQSDTPVMAVPETALMRSPDGDWQVFIEHEANEFEAQVVELGRVFGNMREIIGLDAGTRVVIQGAFFVASEIAKGGFDPHNH